jgi:hypothetical protein
VKRKRTKIDTATDQPNECNQLHQAPDIPIIFHIPPENARDSQEKNKTINLVLGDVGLDATDVRLSLIVLVLVCICLGDFPRISHPHIPLLFTVAMGEEGGLTLSLGVSSDAGDDGSDSASDPVGSASDVVLDLAGGLAALALVVLAAAFAHE